MNAELQNRSAKLTTGSNTQAVRIKQVYIKALISLNCHTSKHLFEGDMFTLVVKVCLEIDD